MRNFALRALSAVLVLTTVGAAYATATHPVPLISQRHPHGSSERWQGGMRCGPTSMAMVARAHGIGGGLSDATLVHHLDLMDGKVNRGTNGHGLYDMAAALGLHPEFSRRAAVLAQASARNDVVVARGSFSPDNRNGHFMVVAQRLPSGNYLVHDPGGEHGTRREMSALELQTFAENHPKGNGGFYVMK